MCTFPLRQLLFNNTETCTLGLWMTHVRKSCPLLRERKHADEKCAWTLSVGTHTWKESQEEHKEKIYLQTMTMSTSLKFQAQTESLSTHTTVFYMQQAKGDEWAGWERMCILDITFSWFKCFYWCHSNNRYTWNSWIIAIILFPCKLQTERHKARGQTQ